MSGAVAMHLGSIAEHTQALGWDGILVLDADDDMGARSALVELRSYEMIWEPYVDG